MVSICAQRGVLSARQDQLLLQYSVIWQGKIDSQANSAVESHTKRLNRVKATEHEGCCNVELNVESRISGFVSISPVEEKSVQIKEPFMYTVYLYCKQTVVGISRSLHAKNMDFHIERRVDLKQLAVIRKKQ